MKLSFKFPKLKLGLPKVHRPAILQALFPKEEIAGLEISDDNLRLLFIKKRGDKYSVESFSEEILTKGVIADGKILDIDELAKAIKRLLVNAKPRSLETREVVLCVNDRLIFAQPVFLPAAIGEEAETQFIHTNLHNFVPYDYTKIYIDWHKIKEIDTKKIIFLASGSRTVIERYRESCFLAGITAVALEPASMALSRALSVPAEGYAVLFHQPDKNSFVISILIGGEIYLKRVINAKQVYGENLSYDNAAQFILMELKGFKDFILSELGEGSIDFLFFCADKNLEEQVMKKSKEGGVIVFKPAEVKSLSSGFDFQFFPAFGSVFGSAIRGTIARGEDTIVSILPVGTELEYVRKKRKLFTSAIKRLTYSILGICIAVFLGLNIFLGTIINSETQRLSIKNRIELPADLGRLEDAALKFNQLVDKITIIQKSMHSPLDILDVIKEINMPGIKLTRVMVQNVEKPVINVSGIAATRESLQLLKDKLSSDTRFSGIEIPIVGSRTQIDFTLSFTYIR